MKDDKAKPLKVLVSGSHGLIGSLLVEQLRERGDEVVRLVRTRKAGPGETSWDPDGRRVPVEELEGFDAVVHLGGASIGDKRWTERYKERLWNSRVVSTDILVKGLVETILPPKVFVAASAIGFYGDRGNEVLTERSERGSGFLADMCVEWEAATAPAAAAGIRTVNLRSGMVLSPQGGALARQLPLFKFGIAGRLGAGTQYVSWISLTDEVRAILHVIDDASVSGPVNLVSPNPVTNAEMTRAIGWAVKRPTLVPAPRWMMAASLGSQLTDEVLLASQRVQPAKLRASRFRFQDEDLGKTVEAMLAPPPRTDEDGESKKKRKKDKKK